MMKRPALMKRMTDRQLAEWYRIWLDVLPSKLSIYKAWALLVGAALRVVINADNWSIGCTGLLGYLCLLFLGWKRGNGTHS